MKYASRLKGGMMNEYDDVDEESDEIEQQLADFLVHLDERYDEIRSISLPLSRENRESLIALLRSLEGFLNVVEEGAEPFENPAKQEFFRNKVNNLLRIIRFDLNYTTPQPKRPVNLPNPKPRRGGMKGGMEGGMEDESEDTFSDLENELEKITEYIQEANEIMDTPIFSLTRQQINEMRELKMIFDDYLSYYSDDQQNTITNLINPIKSKIPFFIAHYNNLQNFLTTVRNERRRATDIMRTYSVENLPDDDRDFLVEEQSNLEESISENETDANMSDFDKEFILDFLRSYYNELVSYLNTQQENIPPYSSQNAGSTQYNPNNPFNQI